MKRKKILKKINKSLEHFETLQDITEIELGYRRALMHIKQLLENK